MKPWAFLQLRRRQGVGRVGAVLVGFALVYMIHGWLSVFFGDMSDSERSTGEQHPRIPNAIYKKIHETKERMRQEAVNRALGIKLDDDRFIRAVNNEDKQKPPLAAAHRMAMGDDDDDDDDDGDYDYGDNNPKLRGGKKKKQRKDDDDYDYDEDYDSDGDEVIGGNENATLAQKFLLLTYMRGGSTYLGELFNQNPNSFIWFEPLDAVYSSLYGSQYGWHPPDVFFDDAHNLRKLPQFERKAIVSAIKSIMSCRFFKLPIEVPTHSFFYFIKSVLNNRAYQSCLKGSNSLGCKGPFAKNICHMRKFPADPDTGPNNSGLTLPECHDLISDINTLGDLRPHFDKLFSRQSQRRMDEDEQFEKFTNVVDEYQSCMSRVRDKTYPCLPILEDECKNTSIRAIKTVRLRMETAREALDADSELVLILMFRDPRGIVASRFKAGFVSANSARDKVREAEMLCAKMSHDYQVYTEMLVKDRYDGRVVMLRYENVVGDPVKIAKRVYWNVLKTAVPDSVMTYLNGSTSSEVDNGMMGTSRKNGTFTANKWKLELTSTEIQLITEVCAPILKRLRYPIDV